MILLHESFFTEVKELTWIYKLFTPVRKEFFEEKIEELKTLTDNNTMISINQIIMS